MYEAAGAANFHSDLVGTALNYSVLDEAVSRVRSCSVAQLPKMFAGRCESHQPDVLKTYQKEYSDYIEKYSEMYSKLIGMTGDMKIASK